jgi:hypothetical protein
MGACDQTLLTAAILNFPLNARNAMPNGGTHETRRIGNKRERNSRCGRGSDDAHSTTIFRAQQRNGD